MISIMFHITFLEVRKFQKKAQSVKKRIRLLIKIEAHIFRLQLGKYGKVIGLY
jgi:hypothetical protein